MLAYCVPISGGRRDEIRRVAFGDNFIKLFFPLLESGRCGGLIRPFLSPPTAQTAILKPAVPLSPPTLSLPTT